MSASQTTLHLRRLCVVSCCSCVKGGVSRALRNKNHLRSKLHSVLFLVQQQSVITY